MTLKELCKVLPAYCTLHVHDRKGSFARTGNPHEFASGVYSIHNDTIVHLACPLSSYTMEIVLEDKE